MTDQVRVLLLDPDGRAAMTGGTGPRLALHRCADVADLVGRATAGAADLAVLVPGSAGLDAIVVSRVRSHGCRVAAVVADRADADLARRIGITDQLAAPLDAVALTAVAQRALPVAAPDAGRRLGTVVAVWGPPGSPGRTTAAGLLAVGAQRAGNQVIVVDADLAGASWSQLSVAPCGSSGLPIALRRAAAGGTGFEDLLVRQDEGVELLPLAPDPQRWVEAAPAAVPVLLDALAQRADLVVLDVGADIRPAHPAYDIGWAHDSAALARTALAAADAVVAVLSAEPVGVHRFASWWPVLTEQSAEPVVLANRVGLPRAGRRPVEQVSAVLQSIGSSGPRVDVAWEPRAADGMLSGNWPVARGWRTTPQRIWAAVAGVAAARAA